VWDLGQGEQLGQRGQLRLGLGLQGEQRLMFWEVGNNSNNSLEREGKDTAK